MKAQSVGIVGLLVLSTVLAAVAPQAAAVAPPGWSAPEQVEFEGSTSTSVSTPLAAVSEDGHAYAAWPTIFPDNYFYKTGSGVYGPESGWGNPYYDRSFRTNGEYLVGGVATLPNGSFAMSAGETGTASVPTVWVHIRNPDGSYPLRMNVTQGQPITDLWGVPQVGADSAGSIFVAWTGVGATRDLFARRFVPPSSWGPIEAIDNRAEDVDYADLAVDPGGNATIVWTQSDGTATSAWASRYAPGVGWATPQLLETESTPASMPGVTASDGGTAIASWTQDVSGEISARAARFVPGVGWAAPTTLSVPADGFVWLFQVASSPGGQAAALWLQYIGSHYEPRAAVFDPDTGWSTPMVLASGSVGASRIGIGMDGEGRALFAFSGRVVSSAWHLYVVWWDPEAGALTEPIYIDEAPIGPDWFAVSVARSGAAVVAWLQYSGVWYNIWAAAYLPPDNTPPSLAIAGPADGSATGNATVIVYGTVEAGADVWVAGARVATTPVSTFAAWNAYVPLRPGENTIGVRAVDAAGNEATASTKVTYNDPVPAIEAHLAASEAALATTQGQLASAQSSLATTQSQLAAAQADLALTRTALNATQNQTSAKDADLQGKVDSAAGSVGAAMLLGVLGLLVGAAAVAMGFVMSKKRPMVAGAPSPAPPLPSQPPAPPPQPPAEPPKTG